MRLIDADALMEHVYRDRLDSRELIAEMVRNAPTIEPEKRTEEHTETHACDCISRQAAIDAVDSETVSTNPEHFKSSEKFIEFMDDTDIASFGKWQWANGFNTALVATTVQLKNLPSAERRGRWIVVSDGYGNGEATACICECSECKDTIWVYKKSDRKWKYCPNCGARMDGGENG